MAATTDSTLSVRARTPEGSRAARRMRRGGDVPGIVYGGGEDPVTFAVDARELRNTLAAAGAVVDLSVDGEKATPVVVKEHVRHAVSGETVHIDLLRVRLDQAIQATVVLDLLGADEAPGVKEGGILEQVTRELTIEALPGDIPDTIQHDVSGVVIGDTITVAQLSAPSGVTLVDDPETVVATVTPPRLQAELEEEIEAETELVAEGASEDEADSAEGGEESGDDAGDSGEQSPSE